MRARVIVVVAAVLAVALAVWGLAVLGGSDERVAEPTSRGDRVGLASRTIEAGAVTVKVRPERVDGRGAQFEVEFDTHSVDLGFDVTRIAHLTVGSTRWSSPTWSGDGAGGHHRSGTLRFVSAGPPTGSATLHFGGLPEPAEASWVLPGS